MMNKQPLKLVALSLLMGIGLCSYANNGTILYAYPMEKITVDGDLSDWSSSVATYPVNAFVFGQELSSEDGVKAS